MTTVPSRSPGDRSTTLVGAAESMDRIYGNQRHIYDLTRRYFLLGRLPLIEALHPPKGGTVLEIACGTAWNLIQAGRRYPDARLFGFDVSATMLHTARSRIARAGLQQRVEIAAGDATAFDGARMFGIASFDRIILSYTLSMIPRWSSVLDEAIRHLAPGGRLHIVDFGDCAHWPRPARRLLKGWLSRFSVSPRRDLRARLAALANAHGLRLQFAPLYGNYAVYAVLTRI